MNSYETYVYQSSLYFRYHNLLSTGLINLVKPICADHSIEFCDSGQDSRNRGYDSEYIGEIAEDSERAYVLFVVGEGEVGR
jgi:hypothetical protein